MPSEKRQRQKEREQAARDARLAAQRRQQQRKTFLTIAGLVVLVIALAALYSAFGGDDDGQDVTTDGTDQTDGTAAGSGEEDGAAGEETAEPAPCPPEEGVDEPRLSFPAAPPDCLDENSRYEAIFHTSAGDIRVLLDRAETPQTTNNFVYLARYGYYDGTELFRSNTGIDIIQGGAPHTNSPSDEGPGYTIPDEGGPWTYEPGDLVMARTPAPDSAGAQFFFSTGPETADLDIDGTYVVFGRVIEGMDVLEAIMATHVDSDPATGEGAPDPVPVVESVEIQQIPA